MQNNQIELTQEEFNKLESELEYLKSVRRSEISEQIKQARAFGDISENAEYDEAKNEQARIEGEIQDKEDLIRRVRVIDSKEINTAVVGVGTLVTVVDASDNEEYKYLISGMMMGSADDPEHNAKKISSESPIAKALIGKKVGKTCTVQAPGGTIKLKILEISRV